MDWTDITLHALGSLVIMTVGLLLGLLPIAFLVNTVLWPAREAYQHKPDYEEIVTHPQSLLEWIVPVALGFIYAGVFW